VLENERSDANIILRAGDQVQIPKIKDFVSVGGAVNTTKLYRQDLLSGDNRVTVIFDGRNLYEPDTLEQMGLQYYAIGRGRS